MSTESDELRFWRQAFAAPGPPPAPEDCPPPERIWSALRGELAADEIRDVVDHTALCASCAEDWRLAAALLAEEPAAAPVVESHPITFPAAAPRRRYMRGWQVRIASLAAAAAMVLIAVKIQQQGHDGREPAVVRGVTEIEGVRPSLRLLVEDGAILRREDFKLRWSEAGEGASYRVWLGTEEGFGTSRPVARKGELKGTEHLIPPAALSHLRSGTKLLWWVEATLPDGTRLRSETSIVELR